MPAVIPDILPELRPMVATAVLLLVHVPPVVASLSVDIAVPMQILVIPVIGAGLAPTVTVVPIVQPVPNE